MPRTVLTPIALPAVGHYSASTPAGAVAFGTRCSCKGANKSDRVLIFVSPVAVGAPGTLPKTFVPGDTTTYPTRGCVHVATVRGDEVQYVPPSLMSGHVLIARLEGATAGATALVSGYASLDIVATIAAPTKGNHTAAAVGDISTIEGVGEVALDTPGAADIVDLYVGDDTTITAGAGVPAGKFVGTLRRGDRPVELTPEQLGMRLLAYRRAGETTPLNLIVRGYTGAAGAITAPSVDIASSDQVNIVGANGVTITATNGELDLNAPNGTTTLSAHNVLLASVGGGDLSLQTSLATNSGNLDIAVGGAADIAARGPITIQGLQRPGTGANAGPTLTIQGANGQAQTDGAANNDGADVVIKSGGAGTGGGGNPGSSGRVKIQTNGGYIDLNAVPGAPVGNFLVYGDGTTQTRGPLMITGIALGDMPAGGAINLVDQYPSAVLNQTTAGQTITLAAPTNGAQKVGLTFDLYNGGSASFSFYGKTVAANQYVTMKWSGSAWMKPA